MHQPGLDILMTKVKSKYELVVAAAKRARILTEINHPQEEPRTLKPVTVALDEIAGGKLKVERPRENATK